MVRSPRARLFGPPNSTFGVWYYLLLAGALWAIPLFGLSGAWVAVLAAVALVPAAVSAALAYSLLFVTRASCPYCWTAHVVNWLLPPLLLTLYAAR